MSCPFLKKEEQRDLLDAMDSEQATPSLSQAQRLKKYSQEGHLTLDMMRVIMGEEKKSDLDKVTLSCRHPAEVFPQELHAPADAGNHHQAAGGVAEEAPERPGTMKGAAYEGYFSP